MNLYKNVLRKHILFGDWYYSYIRYIKNHNYEIKNEKLQYNINKEAPKIALLSGKIDKYEFLAGEKILSSDQRGMVEQAIFTYSLLGKANIQLNIQ